MQQHVHHTNANNTNYSSWQSSYSLNALPLSPTARAKLQNFGFHSVQDVLRHHSLPVQLVKSVPSLTLDEAQDVLKACRTGLDGFALSGAKSASELLKKRTRTEFLWRRFARTWMALGGGRPNRRDYGISRSSGLGRRKLGCSWRCRCNSRTN